MRVLLIDDDPEQLALRRRIVEHAGHTVETAADFATAALYTADVVVTDLHLRVSRRVWRWCGTSPAARGSLCCRAMPGTWMAYRKRLS